MHRDQTPWREKVQELFQTCSDEIKRTTEIGKKMLTASKANSSLHESYEELGRLAATAVETEKVKWDDPKVHELIQTIRKCQQDLETLEEEVNNIKFDENENEKPGTETKEDGKN